MTGYASQGWGTGHITEITTGVMMKPANGVWSIYYDASNLSNSYAATKSFKNVKMTIHYNLL